MLHCKTLLLKQLELLNETKKMNFGKALCRECRIPFLKAGSAKQFCLFYDYVIHVHKKTDRRDDVVVRAGVANRGALHV